MSRVTRTNRVPRATKCALPADCGRRSDGKDDLRTFGAVVRAYLRDYRAQARCELDFFRAQPSFERAVELAALAQGPDGKLRHQWRIPPRLLSRWAQLLTARASSLRQCPDFEALHAAVRATRILGIGKLTVYDTALRIGAKLGMEPAVVYLHAGTQAGAKALGINGSRQSVSRQDLPSAFRRLRPRELEDCLCIYAHAITRVVRLTSWPP